MNNSLLFGLSEVTFTSILKTSKSILCPSLLYMLFLFDYGVTAIFSVFVINNCSSYRKKKNAFEGYCFMHFIFIPGIKEKLEFHLKMHFGNKYILYVIEVSYFSSFIFVEKELNNGIV